MRVYGEETFHGTEIWGVEEGRVVYLGVAPKEAYKQVQTATENYEAIRPENTTPDMKLGL